jgi:pimeloyl-ACP methyl ester carboxylesterase
MLLAPAQDAAALDFSPCGDDTFECATLTVPLDRSGEVPGTVDLRVERRRGAQPPAHTLVFLAGGPGGSATALGPVVAQVLGFLLPADTQVVLYDYRGTGQSGALDCPELQDDVGGRIDPADVRSCAERLGPRRSFYTTRDNVEDLEAVRRALGVDALELIGPSYGSQVAAAYALRYPERVEKLVLDGVVPPEGQDPLRRAVFQATARVLRSLCAGDGCAGITPDPVADLAELVARIRQAGGTLDGKVVDQDGVRRPFALRRIDISLELSQASADGGRRFALLPAAIASAVRGDPAPLLRIRFLDTRPLVNPTPPTVQSAATFVATTCEETRFPWDRTASPREKLRQAADAAARVPDAEFFPFDRGTALENTILVGCSTWPARREPPRIAFRQPPQAPVLVVDGEDDLLTPLEQARDVAARFPGSTFVPVPATGHVGLVSDTTGCVLGVYRAFFAGQAVENLCASKTRSLTPAPRAPRALHEVEPAPGTSGQAGRVVTAARLTLRDALDVARTFGRGQPEVRIGGLRGGFLRATATSLRLFGLVYVPGVQLTGDLALEDGVPVGRLLVAGATSGYLDLARDGSVSGVLDGRPVAAPPAG